MPLVGSPEGPGGPGRPGRPSSPRSPFRPGAAVRPSPPGREVFIDAYLFQDGQPLKQEKE